MVLELDDNQLDNDTSSDEPLSIIVFPTEFDNLELSLQALTWINNYLTKCVTSLHDKKPLQILLLVVTPIIYWIWKWLGSLDAS